MIDDIKANLPSFALRLPEKVRFACELARGKGTDLYPDRASERPCNPILIWSRI